MGTPHNEAEIGQIAKNVIMPGDPLRAKYIAEKYLQDYKQVNSVRGMYAYTGLYKGKEITVMAHGMGIPSMGIYSYELYNYYGVENIIRIGSCGGYSPNLKLFDIILSQKVFSESNYAMTLNNDETHITEADETLTNIIENTASEKKITINKGNTCCTDCFDLYMTDVEKFMNRIPEGLNPLGVEMEAYALFYNAKLLGKKAACLMSVVDSKYISNIATVKEREQGLNTMIELALDSIIKI